MGKVTVRVTSETGIYWDPEQDVTVIHGREAQLEETHTVMRAIREGRLEAVAERGEKEQPAPQEPDARNKR